MADISHLEGAPKQSDATHGSERSLSEVPLVAGVLRRLAWLTGLSFVTAISVGPLFAPASATDSGNTGPVRIVLERADKGEREPEALRCRSHADGRQNALLHLAQDQLGGAPVDHVSTRFWTEHSGEAEVTFEVWHSDHGKLYYGRGTVDMDSCEATLTALT